MIGKIAWAHGKSPAQVMLRWYLQQGRSAIPRSTKPHRIAENIDVFDFELTTDQLARSTPSTTTSAAAPSPTPSPSRTTASHPAA
jgi:diketogulonate reductase-like aldo/keto reductase